MNRITELLKEIETHKEIIENRKINIHENASGNYDGCTHASLIEQIQLSENRISKCKAEIKGRLDALKEEREFLEIAFKKDINYKVFDIEGNADFKTRLASIQEEIKVLEEILK